VAGIPLDHVPAPEIVPAALVSVVVFAFKVTEIMNKFNTIKPILFIKFCETINLLIVREFFFELKDKIITNR